MSEQAVHAARAQARAVPMDERAMDVLLEHLRSALDRQLTRFDDLDGRAALVLGLGGVLATLAGLAAPAGLWWLLAAGAAVALVAAVLALWATVRPTLLTLDAHALVDELIEATGPDEVKYELLIAHLRLHERVLAQLVIKSRLVMWATVALAGAVALVAAAVVVDLVGRA
jgi:hypothetical protein